MTSFKAASWEQEQWVVESFTQTLGGGPVTGTVLESGAEVDSMCGDKDGNLYLAHNQFIDIVTPDGIRYHLAGTGEPGFRDGHASQARFRLGFKANYGAYNIACGPDGTVYVADGGNRRIRRIAQKGEEWQVTSWAGGGSKRLKPGQSLPAQEVSFLGTISVAATSAGEVIVATNRGPYRIAANGETITYLGHWPQSTARRPGSSPRLNIQMGDADHHGNAYFVSRTPDVVVKIDSQDQITHLAGLVISGPPKPRHIGDGPPREVFFDTPNSLVADPDGSAVYVCGGDEYDIRRVPTDGVTHTATLMQNGRWGHASVHPNQSMGAAVIRPNATGHLKPDGELTNLICSPLVGRDAAGNLYGRVVRWRGRTHYIEDHGLLSTHVYRLRPNLPE